MSIPPAPPRTSWRDTVARIACNAILRTVATPWYRSRIAGLIRLGLVAAASGASLPDDPPAAGNPDA